MCRLEFMIVNKMSLLVSTRTEKRKDTTTNVNERYMKFKFDAKLDSGEWLRELTKKRGEYRMTRALNWQRNEHAQ
jgi:hypothetical protein